MKKIVIIIIIAFFIGFGSGLYVVSIFNNNVSDVIADDLALDEQEATIRAIKKVRPAVVSIIVYDYEDFLACTPAGQEVQKHRKQMIKGTGFLISADGFIITNKHVINTAKEETGEYRIILNSGKEYYAQLIGQDPLNDLAVLKIFDKDLPLVALGDSDRLELGTSVIAIGNDIVIYENEIPRNRAQFPEDIFKRPSPVSSAVKSGDRAVAAAVDATASHLNRVGGGVILSGAVKEVTPGNRGLEFT